MNETLMFKRVVMLCKANGEAIDRIANECDINQRLVAKMFMAVMNDILDKVEDAYKKEEGNHGMYNTSI